MTNSEKLTSLKNATPGHYEFLCDGTRPDEPFQNLVAEVIHLAVVLGAKNLVVEKELCRVVVDL